jgi:hypothetical protein
MTSAARIAARVAAAMRCAVIAMTLARSSGATPAKAALICAIAAA